MTEKLKQIVKEEMEKLPKEAQEAIYSVDWAGIAEEIGKKYLLNESEINDFQIETFLVVVGLTDAEFYKVNIENHVGTTRDEAAQMANEAFVKILDPIRNSLEENIKKNLKDKNIKPEDNINFILSGGDYGVFLDNRNSGKQAASKTDRILGSGSVSDMKDRLVN